MPTSGTATNPAGASCPNNSANFTISSSGVLASTASSANQNYTVCIAAHQPGAGAPNPYIQVVSLVPGSAVACDYGPNAIFPAGTVGTDLNTAGFTHCALNADFTDASNAQVNGGPGCGPGSGCAWIMDNPNTYLSQCKGSRAFGLFFLRFTHADVINADGGGDAPCNRAVITTDSGSQVLEFTFSQSDLGGTNNQGIGLYWPLCGNSCSDLAPAANQFKYIEMTFKTLGLAQPSTFLNLWLEDSNVFDADAHASGGFLDTPILEANANNGQTNSGMDHNTVNGECGGKCSKNFQHNSPNFGSYHTLAILTTGDGNANIASCFYLDGANIPKTPFNNDPAYWTDGNQCQAWGGTISSTNVSLQAHDNRFYIGIGNSTSISNFNTMTMVLKSIRVFTCSNYVGYGNNCPGTVVNHS